MLSNSGDVTDTPTVHIGHWSPLQGSGLRIDNSWRASFALLSFSLYLCTVYSHTIYQMKGNPFLYLMI